MITREEINELFKRVNEIRAEITAIKISDTKCCIVGEDDFYLRLVNSHLHEAEQTLLKANEWLGYHVLKTGL